MIDLKVTRTELHALAVYLLETYARAVISGATELKVESINYLNMANAVLKGVMAIESVVGTEPTSNPPATAPSKDPGSQITFLTESVRKMSEDIQKKVLEDLKQQIEKQQQENTSINPPITSG